METDCECDKKNFKYDCELMVMMVTMGAWDQCWASHGKYFCTELSNASNINNGTHSTATSVISEVRWNKFEQKLLKFFIENPHAFFPFTILIFNPTRSEISYTQILQNPHDKSPSCGQHAPPHYLC